MSMDSLIPPIGTVPQAERMFRVNWVANLRKTPSGVPFVSADFVAKQGRKVRVIDVRAAEELTGVLGYVPGSDWVPLDRISTLLDRIPYDAPVIIVSGGEERSHDAVAKMTKMGMRYVAFMAGGVMAWRDLGYSTTRDPSILDRRDHLREIEDITTPPENVTAEDVKRHVGDRLSVKWIKLPALLVRGLVSCVDGRDDSGVIGSPGGDAGEMLVALRSLERLIRRDLTDSEISTLIARRLDVFGRFYMHTDIQASNAVITSLRKDSRFDNALSNINEALDWRRFWAGPPPAVRAALLEHALVPGHIGCGHIRLELTRPTEYETREALDQNVLRTIFVRRREGAPEM
jgi:hypothetical protein